jgi:glutathione S-transferase
MRLVGLSYSPWTLRARWALDHHRLAHRFEEYLPMVQEPLLRARLRRPFGKVTVPVLFDDEGGAHDDSFDIARFADGKGRNFPLVPLAREADVRAHCRRADELLAAGRGLSLRATLASDEALRDYAPAFVPGPLKVPLAKSGVLYLQRKHAVGRDAEAELATMRAVLRDLREALARGGEHVLGELTLADVALALALQMVQPMEGLVALSPAVRDTWTRPELAREFDDLLRWRDAWITKHRPPGWERGF